MAVGQLTHLADTVTLSSNSSASATVPNDGSVIIGDLLLVACVMPSGSRTFAIAGGAGAWTSLGTATQAGHMSQLWWRIAEASDLGAVVTVTPSTGSIRQVLLIGRVRGVLASSPVTAATNTSAAATTKTTPSLGSVGAASREVGVVWDSRGATSPNTSAWTAPGSHTRRGQAFTTAGSGSCSGTWGDSDSTVAGAIGSRVWTADQSALGSAWTLAIAPGEQTVSPARIESTATIPAPTLAPGAVTLQPGRIEPTAVLYGPTLAPGTVTLTPAAVASQATLHAPALTPGAVTLTPGRIASTATIYAPSVDGFDPDVTLTIGTPAISWAVNTPSSGWEISAPW
ncbi:hypothetical protein [Streptomyces sp. NBC_01353]|uniref:hypothetical protein n=1 Tax=Streptomyces sp. NBC_01353 TaxID=2903835 RepID=UPI002E359052|nr:hypothetical protein [Streptomyces sp. NBC_01353]